MSKPLIILGLTFTSVCIGISIYTYHTLIKMDLTTEVNDLISNASERISILEVGLANQQTKLEECRASNLYNKDAFNNYVQQNKSFVVKANQDLTSKEAEITKLYNNINKLENEIKQLNNTIKSLKTAEAKNEN